MGLLIGMALGALIVAVAVWFFHRDDNPFTQPPSAKEAPPEGVAALPGKPGDAPVEKRDFTFYTLPKGGNASAPDGQGQPQAQKQQAAAPVPMSAPATPPAQAATGKALYLQLGAFESAEQADDVKVKLLLMSLNPITQRAQLPDGRTVHRIRVGPFESREDLKAMRTRLLSSGFSAVDEVSGN
ncbi:MAG: SPOR domain-containing protein [Azoarcus sp.]|jgi:cell division protein FtsN|nr:SPOR domain-containing protein [Azoarcus sp.]